MAVENKERNKMDIEVVTGDGNNLNISPVFENSSPTKPKSTKDRPKNIVIPKVKKDNKK